MNDRQFDPEDLKSALGMCMRDASLQRLYKGAPEGAKKALKILFCAAVHPEKVGSEGNWGYLKSVEGDLAKEDLEYLIMNWEGQELQDYFRGLLDGVNRHKPKLGIRRNRTVYLFMQKVDEEAIMLPNGTVFPAELRLGEPHGVVRSLNMDVNNLVFKTKVAEKEAAIVVSVGSQE